MAGSVPFHGDLEEALRERLHRAELVRATEQRTRTAAELHSLAERTRLLIGGDAVPRNTRVSLEASCRSLWKRRTAILPHLRENASDGADSVRQDLLDLAIFGSDLRVSLAAKGEKNAARREALRVLEEAEKMFGPSPALFHRREVHAAAAGLGEAAREAARRRSGMAPRSAGEHLALGRSFVEAGEPRLAVPHFDRALALAPANLWPNFYKGVCSCQMGGFQDAVVAFSVCIGLAPGAAPCYYNRACAYVECNQPARALLDYDRALDLEPGLAVAALNRGRLHFEHKRFSRALEDLHQALQGGADPAAVYYDIARVKLADGQRTEASASRETVLAHDPAHADARRLHASLQRNP